MTRRRMLLDSGRLPNGYKECEYIAGDRDCTISFPLMLGDVASLDLRFTTISSSRQLISIEKPITQDACTYWGVSNDHYELGGNISLKSVLASERNILEVCRQDTYISLKTNNEQVQRNGSIAYGTVPILRLFTNINGINYVLKGRIEYYGIVIKRNGVVINKIIPCLDKQNIPCFYDVVTKKTVYEENGNLIYKLKE